MPTAKDAAREVIDRLPYQATWDDIAYELYVKEKIERGLADVAADPIVLFRSIDTDPIVLFGLAAGA